MKQKTLYFHIGFPKTASTFFQKEIMPSISSLKCISSPYREIISGKNPGDSIVYRYFQHSPEIWDDRLGDVLFRDLFGEKGVEEESRDVLLSDENAYISGSRDPFFVAEHMKKFREKAFSWGFSEFKVLAAFRRQDTWIASAYSQTSNRYEGASQSHFEEKVKAEIDPNERYYKSRIDLDYALQYRLLTEVVGEDKLIMTPYGLMKKDTKKLLKKWLSFINVKDEKESILSLINKGEYKKRNVRSKKENTWEIRDKNTHNDPVLWLRPGRVFAALGIDPPKLVLRWPDLNRGEEIRPTAKIREDILTHFEGSNRALAEQIDVDLSQFGYY
jgi:hypothetical protein